MGLEWPHPHAWLLGGSGGDWVVILQPSSLGPFSWQRQCAERKSRTRQGFLGPRCSTPTLPLHSESGLDSRAAEIDSPFTMEELQSHTMKDEDTGGWSGRPVLISNYHYGIGVSCGEFRIDMSLEVTGVSPPSFKARSNWI